ncbi:MAG TPA: hypothetical protein VMV05_05675 [bacterium]|nr:hypothetical protein [bacterium]
MRRVHQKLLWVLVTGLALGEGRAQPAPVTGLAVLAPYNGQVNLAWTPNPTATSYNVYRYLWDLTNTPTPYPSSTPVANLPASALPLNSGTPVFQDSQVTNGRPYYYQVTGLDSANAEGAPASVLAQPFAYPAPVQPVTVRNIHANALDVSWGVPVSSYPISYYNVYQFAYLTFTPTLSPTITATPTDSPTGTLTPTHPATPPTSTPTPTFPAVLTPVSTLFPLATLVGTVTTNSFVDGNVSPNGVVGYYYIIVPVDSLNNPGGQPSSLSNGGLPSNLSPPGAPSLAGQVGPNATPVIGTNGYGVRLTWNGAVAAEGVTAYQINRNGAVIATLPYGTPTPAMVYDDSALPPTGAPATYLVTAVNANGTSDSNKVFEVIVEPSLSAAITVTPDATANAVTISWGNAVTGTLGLGGYWVYKGTGGVPSTPTPGTPGTNTPTPFATVVFTPSTTFTLVPIVDTPIVNHTSYWVVPFDGTMNGGSVKGALTPSLNLAPTPPTGVQATNPTGNNAVTVSWQPAANGYYQNVQGYLVYRQFNVNNSPTGTPTLATTVNATQTGVVDYFVATPNIPPSSPTPTATPTGTLATATPTFTGTLSTPTSTPTPFSVQYWVAASDAQGNISDPSNLTTPVFGNALGLPLPPVVLPVAGDSTTLTFSWAPNPAADGVDYYGIFDPANLSTPLTTVAASSPLTFQAPATLWNAASYVLMAHNPAGYGPSTPLTGIPGSASQITATLAYGSRQVQLSWTMVPTPGSTPEVDTYVVYRSKTPGAGFAAIASVTLTSPGYTDTAPSLAAGNNYYYRVTVRAQGQAESPLYPAVTPAAEASAQTWPNVPAGVVAASNGATLVNIGWVPNATAEAVTGYQVLQDGTPIATLAPSPTLSVPATQTAGNVYGYQVVAQNAQGPSDVATVNLLAPPAMTPTFSLLVPAFLTPTPSQTPAFPAGVWVSGLSYPPAVTGYTLYRQNSPAPSATPTFQYVTALSSPASMTEDTAAPSGYILHYALVANGGGVEADFPASAQAAVTLWPNPPVVGLSASGNAVTLTWATPTPNDAPVSYFTLYRSLYPTLTPTPIATILAPGSSYPDAAVTPGVAYRYWMDAWNASGGSGLTPPQNVIPIQPPVIALTPLAGGNLITWGAIAIPSGSAVTGFVVFRAPMPTPGLTPVFNPVSPLIVEGASNTGFSYSDGPLSDNGSYLYEVVPATNVAFGSVLGSPSNQVAVTVLPRPVTNLSAVSGDGLVQLRWDYQGLATTSYDIYRKLTSAPDSDFQALKLGYQGVNYLDNGLVDKNGYTYRVYTVEAGGLTSTAFVDALALPARPPIVQNESVSVSQDTSSAQTVIGNTLLWTGADQPSDGFPPTGVDNTTMYPLGGYHIYSSTDGGGVYTPLATLPATLINGVAAAQCSYFDAVELIGGSTYTYLVQAFDAPPDCPVSLAHATSYNSVTAYPISPDTALDRNALRPNGSPNEQVVKIRFVVTEPGKVNIKVYGLSGTFVRELVNGEYGQKGIYWTQWDGRNMNGSLVASGVYLVSTESPGNHREFQKVAVIK